MKDTNEQHSHSCNCEECTWARDGEICATCGCIVDRGCPCESVEMKDFEPQVTSQVRIKIRTFNLYWLTGDVEEVSNPDLGSQFDTLASAMNSAGIGGGALRALDYWKETTDAKETNKK